MVTGQTDPEWNRDERPMACGFRASSSHHRMAPRLCQCPHAPHTSNIPPAVSRASFAEIQAIRSSQARCADTPNVPSTMGLPDQLPSMVIMGAVHGMNVLLGRWSLATAIVLPRASCPVLPHKFVQSRAEYVFCNASIQLGYGWRLETSRGVSALVDTGVARAFPRQETSIAVCSHPAPSRWEGARSQQVASPGKLGGVARRIPKQARCPCAAAERMKMDACRSMRASAPVRLRLFSRDALTH